LKIIFINSTLSIRILVFIKHKISYELDIYICDLVVEVEF